jgi:GntR family transcriptional regulator, transcriptional repressor for pyruvate dehydrogenase complex
MSTADGCFGRESAARGTIVPRPLTSQRRRLVNATAERMRELVMERAPGALLGSLPELARLLGVGTATVQQAARVLEHEGLLAVRRGPKGGYFGRRPDAAALERALAAFLRVRGSDIHDSLDLMTLLDCELMPAAARLAGVAPMEELAALKARLDHCATSEDRIALEKDLHALLFRLVDRPLMELLSLVTGRFYRDAPLPAIFEGPEAIETWRRIRHDVIEAVIAGDDERARFEAERYRRELLRRLGPAETAGGARWT